MSRVAQSIYDLVGNTPLVRLQRVAPDVQLKLESRSPTGSIKDRVALFAVEKAIAEGKLSPGQSVIEPSLGNTAISIAFACATRKVKLTVVLPDSTSLERRALLRSYGAKLELTPYEAGLAGAIQRAKTLATADSVTFNLWDGRAALEAHARATGPELIASLQAQDSEPAAFLCGVGSGATFTALGRILRAAFPNIELFAVESSASRTVSGSPPKPHRVSELGFQSPPPLWDAGLNARAIAVGDGAAWQMKARLGKEEGLLVGVSTGANVVAALEVAQALGPGKQILTLACDSGEREFSLAEQFA